MFAASCEKDLEPALPQVNPQPEIVAVGDVTSVPAGVLAGDAHSLNLNDYTAENASILVMNPAETKDLPAGATISYKIEFSPTADFERVREVEVFNGMTTETEDNYYVSAEAWNSAHLEFFGRSPIERDMYYRMPAYIVVDGSDFRYGGLDYYAQEGVVKEYCVQTFSVENNYYLLGDMTTWSLSNASAVKENPFYHNPDVDPYDDPNFSIIFSVSQAVLDANGGHCDWQIAPESLVGSNDMGALIGPKNDNDESTSGELVASNAGKGRITEKGRYELSINLENMTYNLVHLENVIYLVGAPNGWSQSNANIYLSETADDSNIYTGLVKVDAGQFSFRFYSQLGNWDKGSIGSQNEDSAIDISFNAEGVYKGDVFQSGVNASLGKGSWNVPDWEGGAVNITLDLNNLTIEMKKASIYTGVYLRGGMNDWGAPADYEFVVTDRSNIFEIVKPFTIAKGTEFKVADANWSSINLGAFEGENIVKPDVEYRLNDGDNPPNFKMENDFNGTATLTYKKGIYYLLFQAVNE